MTQQTVRTDDTTARITLHRSGKQWPLPYRTNLAHDDFVRARLADTLHPGDVLDLPFIVTSTIVEIAVWPPTARETDRCWFARKTHPYRITLQFHAFDSCPQCDTRAAHQVEIPEYETWWDGLPTTEFPHRRYVFRTCITCRNSWEQDEAQ
ncbi:Uncharacterised protein [Mycobacteroides abscessus subsp. abscessus]|uniref:hypothetical protein n=1 Tax=Mycobacteroides abscessus TaxID=36809 RepID=UPI0009A6BDA4|nr:hypothetical protein [Mycobacteroides abscessus]SLJ40586.1 Uncharacterised protein [Mycobacteroides abscessus subsp. abscessus]